MGGWGGWPSPGGAWAGTGGHGGLAGRAWRRRACCQQCCHGGRLLTVVAPPPLMCSLCPQKRRAGMGYVQRAREAVGGAVAAVAGAVMPGRFKASRSTAELAYGEAEGYAEPGTAEHKGGGWREGPLGRL